MLIKVLLVAAAIGVALYMLRGRPRAIHHVLWRLGGLALVVLAIVAVLDPDITVWAAHLVGVKRGTDLVLYVTVMAFWFVTVATFRRFHALERQVTTLTRELALLSRPADHGADG